MPIGTTDTLIRVKALRKVAYALSGKSLDAEAFDLIMRNIYSDTWVLVNPNILSQKSDKVPTQQVIHFIHELSRQRVLNTFKCVSEDYTRTCYLTRLNAGSIQHTCRRKTKVYILHKLEKKLRYLSGDRALIEASKCGGFWENMCIFSNESNGDVGSIPYADLHRFKWENVL
jgi:hypothetical protein